MLEEHEGRLFPPEQLLFTRKGLGLASLFFANRNIPIPPYVDGSRPAVIPGAEFAAGRGAGILPTRDADHESRNRSARRRCSLRRRGGARNLRRIGHPPGGSAVPAANGVLPVQTHRADTLPDERRSACCRASGSRERTPTAAGHGQRRLPDARGTVWPVLDLCRPAVRLSNPFLRASGRTARAQ